MLFLGSHMHEWGKAFRTRHLPVGLDEQVLLDEPVWDPVYRDAPNIHKYQEGELVINTGDKLNTSCTWFNDQPEDIVFPHEMCTTFGMVYPQKLPFICDAE
jgi:hypothetical protein